jgi:hypothetical protein
MSNVGKKIVAMTSSEGEEVPLITPVQPMVRYNHNNLNSNLYGEQCTSPWLLLSLSLCRARAWRTG